MDGIQENGVMEKCMARGKKFDLMEACDTMGNGREDNPFGHLVMVEDGVNRAKTLLLYFTKRGTKNLEESLSSIEAPTRAASFFPSVNKIRSDIIIYNSTIIFTALKYPAMDPCSLFFSTFLLDALVFFLK